MAKNTGPARLRVSEHRLSPSAAGIGGQRRRRDAALQPSISGMESTTTPAFPWFADPTWKNPPPAVYERL
jgi:hypothetical protein